MADEEVVSGLDAGAAKAPKPVDGNVKVKSVKKAMKTKADSAKAVKKAPAAAAEDKPKKMAEKAEERSGGGSVDVKVPKELIVGAIVVLLVITGLIWIMSKDSSKIGETVESTTTTLPGEVKNPNIAEEYDIVSVDYTGMYANGTVFDTSIKDVAEKAGIYMSTRTYEPVTFSLGYGTLIKGFEEAVTGMTIGQEKEVSLPPEKAYGYASNDRIQVVQKIQKSPIVQNVSIDKFRQDIGQEPAVGLEFTIPNRTDFELDWPMKIIAVYNDTLTFRYEPGTNTTLNTVFGPAQVYGVDNDIVIQINPKAGQKIVTLYGPARVVDANDVNATIDFNPELAGQTIKFRLKLLNVVKQSQAEQGNQTGQYTQTVGG